MKFFAFDRVIKYRFVLWLFFVVYGIFLSLLLVGGVTASNTETQTEVVGLERNASGEAEDALPKEVVADAEDVPKDEVSQDDDQSEAVPEEDALARKPSVETKLIPDYIKFPILGDLKVKEETDEQTDEQTEVVRYTCKPAKDHYMLGALSLTKPVVNWDGNKEYKFVVGKASFLGIAVKNFTLEKVIDTEGEAPTHYSMSFDLSVPFRLALPPILSVSLSKMYVDFIEGDNEIAAYTTVTLFDKIPVKLIFSKTENGISAQGLLGDIALASLLPKIKSLSALPPLKEGTVVVSNLQDIKNAVVEVSGATTLFDKDIILKAIVAFEKAESPAPEKKKPVAQKNKKKARSKKVKKGKKEDEKPARTSVHLKVIATLKSPAPLRPFESVPLIDKIPLGSELKKIEINNVEFEFDSDTLGVIIRGDVTVLGLPALIEGQGGKTGFAFMASPRDEWTLGTVIPFLKGTPLELFKFEDTAVVLSTLQQYALPNGMMVGPGISVSTDLALKGNILLDNLKIVLLNQLSRISFFASIGSTLDKFKLMGIVPIQIQMGPYLSLENVAVEIAGLGPSVALLGSLKFLPPPWAKIIPDEKGAQQQEPLLFTARVNVMPDKASGAGTMQGDWINPLGLRGLTIGNVAAEIGIDYSTFASTYCPTVFGITGELGIGSKKAAMALKVSANVSDLVLMGKLNELSLSDLTDLINKMGLKVPKAKAPHLSIKKPEIFIAPKGGAIGEIVFEPGFKVKGRLEFLNKFCMINITIDPTTGIIGRGSMSAFDFGPLKVTGVGLDGKSGTADDGPTVDLELTMEKQGLLISGDATLWGSLCKIEVRVNFDEISFEAKAKLSDLFNVELSGKSIQPVDSGTAQSTESMDFTFTGVLKEDFKAFVQTSVVKSLKELQDNVLHGKDVQKTLEEKRKEIKDLEILIQGTKKRLRAERGIDRKINKARSRVNSLQDELDKIKREIRDCGGSANLIIGWGKRPSRPSISRPSVSIPSVPKPSLPPIDPNIEKAERLPRLYVEKVRKEAELVVARGTLVSAERLADAIDTDPQIILLNGKKAVLETSLKVLQSSRDGLDKALAGAADLASLVAKGGDIIQIKHAKMTGKLSDITSGKSLPLIEMDLVIQGKSRQCTLAIDQKNVANFIAALITEILKV